MDCPDRSGSYVQKDYFVLENVDPATERSQGLGELGELVLTSLWDDGRNFVRWAMEDMVVST